MRRWNLGSVIGITILLAASAGYDFWRGYHAFGNMFGGSLYVVLGFGVLGLLWLIIGSRSQRA